MPEKEETQAAKSYHLETVVAYHKEISKLFPSVLSVDQLVKALEKDGYRIIKEKKYET
ncbi:MAG: hypothetical protein KAW93_09200 [Methanogenium sp.]|nr:hypothetical protein [Methanogenium sp.]